jgi:hypothetical protein
MPTSTKALKNVFIVNYCLCNQHLHGCIVYCSNGFLFYRSGDRQLFFYRAGPTSILFIPPPLYKSSYRYLYLSSNQTILIMKKTTIIAYKTTVKTNDNRLLHTVKKRGLKYFFLFTVLIFSSNLFAQWPGNAPVNPPVDSFRIDGTLKANTAVGDWVDGTGSGGYVLQSVSGVWGPVISSTTTFVRDTFDHTSDRIFTGSSFGDNPNSWSWTTGKPTSKCDISTAIFHVSSSPNSKWIIIGGDRLTTQGTSYIDFEFSQGLFTRTLTGFSSLSATGGSLAATNGRTPGDFVLSMEYSNGGSNATVHYYVWKLSGAVYKYVEETIPFIIAPLQPAGAVAAYGKTNADSTDVPYLAFGKSKYIPYSGRKLWRYWLKYKNHFCKD